MNADHDFRHNWHVAVNDAANAINPRPHFMYEAMDVAAEVPRMTRVFAAERQGLLTKVHRQCSHSEPEPIAENFLTCCLGKRCSTCPYLLALNPIKGATPSQIDEAKAWTCATHIIREGGDVAREGFILTEDDKLYWKKVYDSMSNDEEPPL